MKSLAVNKKLFKILCLALALALTLPMFSGCGAYEDDFINRMIKSDGLISYRISSNPSLPPAVQYGRIVHDYYKTGDQLKINGHGKDMPIVIDGQTYELNFDHLTLDFTEQMPSPYYHANVKNRLTGSNISFQTEMTTGFQVEMSLSYPTNLDGTYIGLDAARDVMEDFFENTINGKYGRNLDRSLYEYKEYPAGESPNKHLYEFSFIRYVNDVLVHNFYFHVTYDKKEINTFVCYPAPPEEVVELIPDLTDEQYVEIAKGIIEEICVERGSDITILDISLAKSFIDGSTIQKELYYLHGYNYWSIYYPVSLKYIDNSLENADEVETGIEIYLPLKTD